jgi:hypothetical protein
MRGSPLKNIGILATVVFVLGASSSQARPAGAAAGWSAMSGETVGWGNTVFWGQAGFPGFSATLLYGIHDKVDLGARLSFTYGDGETPRVLYPGLKAQGIARVQLFDAGSVRFALRIEPGVAIRFISRPPYAGGTFTQFGLALPGGIELGFPINRYVALSAGIDVPLLIVFGDKSDVFVPILMAGGIEYFFDPELALTLALKAGPQIYKTGGSDFALNALLGIAAKF